MATRTSQTSVDEIFRDLQAQILSGRLAVGQRLPSERRLAEIYGAHRHTLREATIRLEQQGLVSVRHGQGATVEPFRQTGHITILAPFLEHASDDEERLRVFLDLLPSRVEVLAVAARMASQRATEADHARLASLASEAVAAFDARDKARVAAAYHSWLEALVDAAHSLPVRWMANALLEVNHKVTVQFPDLWVFEASFPDHMGEVLGALNRGDGDVAVTSMRTYFERVDAQLLGFLHAILDAPASEAKGDE